MINILFVALGGALGASARYAISLIPVKTEFPILTFITNIVGAFLIGFITGLVSVHENISPSEVLFLKTGVCGGFTTFSTFSLEALQLFQQNKVGPGLLYTILSGVCCIVCVYIGQMTAMKAFH